MGGLKGKRKHTNETKRRGSSSEPEFSEDEKMLMDRMYRLIGPRWPLIAGRIPGRTGEEVEKYFAAKFDSSTSQ